MESKGAVRMTRTELERIRSAAKAKVTVSCDEYHPHSAQRGCLHGDNQAIDILKLCEYIDSLTAGVRVLVEKVAK